MHYEFPTHLEEELCISTVFLLPRVLRTVPVYPISPWTGYIFLLPFPPLKACNSINPFRPVVDYNNAF